jgi:1-acyl-sn-glycerol-3-phosphate acyltransferase
MLPAWQLLSLVLFSTYVMVVCNCRYIRQLLSPVFFSTSDDGEVEQGLSNIPTDRPVLFVGNHLYFGVELSLVVGELLKQRNLLVRGLAHPFLFKTGIEEELQVSLLSIIATITAPMS